MARMHRHAIELGVHPVSADVDQMPINEAADKPMTIPLPPPPLPPTVGTMPGRPASLEGRDPATGRFVVGNLGKPRGARNRVAAEIDRLLEESAPEAFRIIMGAVSCGDERAAMWILDRVAPPRKGRPMALPDLPPVQNVGDIAPALSAIAGSVAAGDISPEEAATLINVLQKILTTLEAAHSVRSGLLTNKDGSP